jgi:signal transduction histidine kinase
LNSPDLTTEFAEYDRKVRIRNSRLGAIWAMILMPAGISLDLVVYFKHWPEFLGVRLLCSFLVWIVRLLFNTPFGERHYRALGMIWYLLPALAISWMIFYSGEPASPYYAGLNIVLIGAGLFLPWTSRENLLAWGLVMAMYAGACLLVGWPEVVGSWRYIFNNLYFLILTGLIVVIASYYHSGTRYREFALRFELDRNKHVLEEANQRLKDLDEAKSRFFANISHELRTPLTLLLAPLESIRQKRDLPLDAQTRDWLDTMHANGMRLLKLINDLLDLVRLESGQMQLRPETFSVPELVKGLVSAVHKMADDKRVKLRAEIADSVGDFWADRDKLEKIFLNLLFNAIKFTPGGGEITFGVTRTTDDGLCFVVKDTGMGIPAEQMKNVFTRFWQADSSAQRKYQGVGIGLALVKELAEAHHGTVTVQSEVGVGTTFTVTIPPPDRTPDVAGQPTEAQVEEGKLQPAQAAPEPVAEEEWLSKLYRRAELFPAMTPLQATLRPQDALSHGRRARLLVADDEPDMLRYLNSHLAGDFHIFEAVDGRQAVEMAQQYEPDVILCDMMMPEMDGLEVCRRLRQRPATQHVPILLLTARADEETKIEALTAGASDFLSKPFSTTELRVRLRNLCQSHLLQRELAWQNKKLEATLEQLKETETQLVQSEKLASLGRLSAGIIHEINNPLNYARTALHALKGKQKHLPESERPDFDEILHDTEEGISRVAQIISDLRTFSHPNPLEQVAIDARELVESALRFLAGEWHGRVTVHNELPDDLVIHGNRHKLVQVLVNLFQNASDALAGKTFPDGESAELRITHRHRPGVNIIALRDNGPGMDRATLAKVFDPFFTTKEVGKGVGLGLSICHQIMAEHAGRIEVTSEAGKYCEFALEFPEKPAD